MIKPKDKTKVIFRVHKGEVMAIFPEIPWNDDPFYCCSYMHVGQHGCCDPSAAILDSLSAKVEDYSFLKQELESEPYNYELEVVKRQTAQHYLTRKNLILASHAQAS